MLLDASSAPIAVVFSATLDPHSLAFRYGMEGPVPDCYQLAALKALKRYIPERETRAVGVEVNFKAREKVYEVRRRQATSS